MDDRVTYEEDVYLWSLQQADALRRLAASRPDLPNDLDLPNIAEEIEAVGRSELNAVRSLLTRALVHLIKLAIVSDDAGPVRHWRSEVRVFLRDAESRMSPGMRQWVDLQRIWRNASHDAMADLQDEAIPALSLPRPCPLDLAMLLTESPDVDALVARVRASGTSGVNT